MNSRSVSEQIFERELDLSRGKHGADRTAKTRRFEDPDWNPELRAVPQIESLGPKHKCVPFSQAEVFDERKVGIDDPAGSEGIAANFPTLSNRS